MKRRRRRCEDLVGCLLFLGVVGCKKTLTVIVKAYDGMHVGVFVFVSDS